MLLGYQGNSLIQNPGQYANDELNPSTWQTFKSSTESTFLQPILAGKNLYDYATGEKYSPKWQQLNDEANTLNQVVAQSKGFSGDLADFSGQVAGTFLNPLTILPIGKAASVGADAVGSLLDIGAEKSIIPTIESHMAIKTLAQSSTVGGIFGGLATVPSAVNDNYNQMRNTINWMGVAKETALGTAEGAAVGLAIGAIPFAKGLIKSKLAKNEPVTNAEEDFANASLEDNLSQDSQDTATQAIQKYVDSENVTLDQGTVNTAVMKISDLGNLQSSLADMVSAKGDLDQETFQKVAGSSPTMAMLLGDRTTLDALDSSVEHLNSINDSLKANIQKVLGKRQATFANTLVKNNVISKDLATRLPDMEPENFLKTVSQPLKVLENKTNLSERSLNHLKEMQELDSYQKQVNSNENVAQTVKNLKSLKAQLPKDSGELSKGIQNYMNERTFESGKMPKGVPETSAQEAVTQKKLGAEESTLPKEITEKLDKLDDPKVSDPEKFLLREMEKSAKAFESIKSNNKVFEKLAQCINDKIG